MAALTYALVARGSVVLAEHNAGASPNVGVVALRILAAHAAAAGAAARASYQGEGLAVHLLCADGITYLVVADGGGRAAPFAFLEGARADFAAQHGAAAAAAAAAAYELSPAFAPRLAARMAAAAAGGGADVVGRVRGEVAELREVVVSSINHILERGERLDALVDKTDDLAGGALVFKRGAGRLRAQAWWREKRATLAAAGAVVGLVYLLGATVCGLGLNHC
jgi:vesicle-associated membrane protein 7